MFFLCRIVLCPVVSTLYPSKLTTFLKQIRGFSDLITSTCVVCVDN